MTKRRAVFLFTGLTAALIAAAWSLRVRVQAENPSSVQRDESPATVAARLQQSFQQRIQPLLKEHCQACHNGDEMQSGIRVDLLTGAMEDRQLFLWEAVRRQIESGAMPPEDEPQPTVRDRELWLNWINDLLIAARKRPTPKNGSIRRLTVAQYRNTLRDLLGLEEDLTSILPADGVSKDGFVNNEQTLSLSPLLIEAYFDIAEQALDRCIVDPDSRPVIQNFRMDFGEAINPEPCPDTLVLGALSRLLPNADFRVTELTPQKPFAFDPFRMRTKYEFIEGYQGNDTVRGWRKYDSIYHSVFACVRGTDGYPKGLPYQTVPTGLLLRPAIPSSELFGQSSTYGPMANFKISLRELPEQGRFRITVKAARYDDGLLLDPGTAAASSEDARDSEDSVSVVSPPASAAGNAPTVVAIPQPGIYQVDVLEVPQEEKAVVIDASRLDDGLIGAWDFNDSAAGQSSLVPKDSTGMTGRLAGDAKFAKSPFGRSLGLDGRDDAFIVPHHEAMHVGEGDFTVAAWIHPRRLRQAGIVSLGQYGWTHGWILDMPGSQGVLRLETSGPGNQSNGTVQSPPQVLRANAWQHVAVVVRRQSETRLFVNGYEVAKGTIGAANLDNPKLDLHIGRIPDAQQFHGEIDEVRLYRRALNDAELQALIEPGRQFASPPFREKTAPLTLVLGDRSFTGVLRQPAFLAVRLPAGPLPVELRSVGTGHAQRIVFTRLTDEHEQARRFTAFEQRSPSVGVHLGLRRDCGSTLAPVGEPRKVASTEPRDYVFEGDIRNFPSPDVEKDNVNYLAGIREIGVRSEFTDGRDMPRLQVRSVEFEGPYHQEWPPATHRRIFIDSPHQNDPANYAREIIRSFAARAFRGPVSEAEVQALFAVWQKSFVESRNFRRSIKDALLVAITSPRFLFLIESSSTPEPEPIDEYELASKLSYFLWNTAPDQRLLDLAATNTLRSSLNSEVARLIADPRFRQFADSFAAQWLSLDKFDVVQVDQKLYPQLTRDARAELRKEPARFLEYLIRSNRPLKELIQSDFVVANEVVANYYGLGDRVESGFEFVPVRHDTPHLGGLLSQPAILAGLSNGRESNPIKRGAWLARKIIASPPDDPPPNVPALPEDDTSRLTLREKLERHRNQPGCAKCHAGIDPWGLPLEQFDAGGRWKKEAAEAGSTLPDGTAVSGYHELRSWLADEHPDRVAFSVLKHLAVYASGRSLSYSELEFLKEQAAPQRAGGYPWRKLIEFIVASDLFLTK